VKKTTYEWKKFQVFCEQQVNGNSNVMNVPAATLDKLLDKFFKDVRKQNGGEYEPDGISSFQKSIHRHLKELKLPFNILQEEDFRRSREVLAAKRTTLVNQGRGNKPNACRELTTEEGEKLFESGEFGCHYPEALQCTLWWFFSLPFRFRATDESRKLCGATWSFKMIQKQAKKFWFGWQKKGARPGKAWKVLTSDSSTQKYSHLEQKDARSASLSFLKAIVRKRQRLQVIRFSLP